MVRTVFVHAHRYVGLVVALFLILEGITGSLLAFNTALERGLNPQLFAEPAPGARRLGLGELAERAEALVPSGQVDYLFNAPNQILVRMEPRERKGAAARPLGFDQLFLDPWTGKELGRRMSGDLSQGKINVMPFVYDVHAELTLGASGETVLGLVALLWTIDCFTALYLTLPRTADGFLRRWALAWRVKWNAGAFRLNFDLHRAGGLWPWALLLVFAWSSVMLALPQVYETVTKAVLPFRSASDLMDVEAKRPVLPRRIGWQQAEAIGRSLLAEQARRQGIVLGRPDSLSYIGVFGAYAYSAISSRDVRGTTADTTVWFDGNTGALREFMVPTGREAGATVGEWLWALHFADLADGLWYRVVVAALGAVIAMLSVAGIYIWLKKRGARALSRRQSKRDAGAAT